jgi:hypothetical protein
MTLTGHDGKKVDVDPERIEGLEWDGDGRFTRIFLFGGNWLSVVMPRQDVRAAIDVALKDRRLVEEARSELEMIGSRVEENGRRLDALQEQCSIKPTAAESREKLGEVRTLVETDKSSVVTPSEKISPVVMPAKRGPA